MPSVEWRVQSEESNEVALPADNKQISVQSRGGPSQYELTSWLQLMDIERGNSGKYTCVASNAEGQAQASAFLTVGNFKKSFPLDI